MKCLAYHANAKLDYLWPIGGQLNETTKTANQMADYLLFFFLGLEGTVK